MDRLLAEKLLALVPGAHIQFEGDTCVGVHLVDPSHLYHGLARQHSPSDKKEILHLISGLSGLRYLDLRKNRFGPIPDLGLQLLEYVDLGSNYMGSVPYWLYGLNLIYLNLGVNELRSLPDWIADYPSLRVLKLHKNVLTDASPVANLKSLSFLNLYFNRIKRMPSFLWELPEINFFSWGVSGVEELPEGVGNWKKLEWLSLVANHIEKLPEAICDLTQLRGMRLHKNRLTALPERIGDLQRLEQLTLYRNQLQSLPESFSRLRLKKLNLAHNLFDGVPSCVNKDCLQWECYERSDCLWDQ